jgi:hypothetical protein
MINIGEKYPENNLHKDLLGNSWKLNPKNRENILKIICINYKDIL